MRHLSRDEMLAALDGASRAHGDSQSVATPQNLAHAAHLRSCDICRERVNALQDVVARISHVEVPEPSPLFWDHLSERVREAVTAEPASRPSRLAAFAWIRRGLGARSGLAWTASVVAVVAVVAVGLTITRRSGPPIPRSLNAETAPDFTSSELSSLERGAQDDPTWAFMGDLASQVEWDGASDGGFVLTPGSAERALGGMSQEEQQRVVELLEQEIQKLKRL
jgi:hypothetical protein